MKLLLVDDEEYVIESIKRNLDLTETGVSEVCTAFSVQQAKNIMGMVDIDIVISDIVMPGGTGFDFVEWVRKEELKVQVIFLTSYAEFDYARRAIQLNSVDYLLKPIDFEKLNGGKIDPSVAEFFNPVVMIPIERYYVSQLAEKTGHSMDERRYMWKVEY